MLGAEVDFVVGHVRQMSGSANCGADLAEVEETTLLVKVYGGEASDGSEGQCLW